MVVAKSPNANWDWRKKELISGDVDLHERDQQFRLIATLCRQARARGVPVLCVDTRKKERLGHLPRRGSCYSTDVQFVVVVIFEVISS